MDGGDKSRGNKKFQKSYFDVLGLCCSSEVPLIEKILKPLEGVKDVSVIVPSQTVIVVHDNLIISQFDIVKALNQARLEANVRVYGESNYQKKWPSPYAIACGVLLLLSFLKYIYRPFQWLTLGAVAIGICPIILRGIVAIRNFTLDTNILAIIAVIGSIALHDYWEAASIVFLFTIAQWLESRASHKVYSLPQLSFYSLLHIAQWLESIASHKANAVMSSLMNMVPQKAILAETGEEVDAGEVEVNTILAVKAGEIIPIDGIVVDGKCEVDEKTLTGESFPVLKQNGSTIWAGTINLNGYISVRTTALAEDCVVARMAKLVEEAQNNKSKTQRFIDKCAKFYTPAVVAISVALAVVPAILRLHNQKEWFHLALVVLVSACPCALILSTPVATFCALSKAATLGLLIKGGEYLETLAKIKIMAFDKTGTITKGEFVVTKFQSVSDDVSLNTLLYWVSSIESKSSHPMAAALIDYGRSHSIEPMSEKVEEFENFPGEGIHGKIDGSDVYVGNLKIAFRAGCSTVPSLEGDTMNGKSIGYIFLGSAPVGIFSLSDTCRTGAKEAIIKLKSMGIKTAMLTGDSHEVATLAQNQLEGALEVIHAGLLPQDKARIIKQFQEETPTAMVGDGLNDAPALAAADIGISMGISGSALATETGNVILMSNDIRKIPKIIHLARRARRKIIVNVISSILTKVAILALAFAGYPFVWAAVLADVGTCLVVILNSMLLLRGNHKHVTKCCKSYSKAQKTTKTCSSQKRAQSCQFGPCNSSSCDNKTSSNSTNINGCSAPKDQQQEAKHSDQENQDMATRRIRSNGIHKNCCTPSPLVPISCVEKKCTNNVERHNIRVEDDEAKCCDHGNHNKSTTTHDIASRCSNVRNHLNLSSSEINQNTTTNGHCHSNHCNHNHVEDHIVDEEQGNFVETSCQNPNHGANNCSALHASIDISSGNDHIGCIASKVCLNLENREVGGCCKSFRKECCGKNGNFGATFRGGLTKITTE